MSCLLLSLLVFVSSQSCLPLEAAVASIIMYGVKCYYQNDHRRCPARDPRPKGLVKCQQGHRKPEAHRTGALFQSCSLQDSARFVSLGKKKKKSKICNVRINQRTVSRAFGFSLMKKGKGQRGRWLISLCDWCGSAAKCQQNETRGGVFLQAARGPGCISDRVHAIGSRSSWVSSSSAPRERYHQGGTGLNPSAFFSCRCPTFTGSCAIR